MTETNRGTNSCSYDEHQITADELCARIHTDIEHGLHPEEAKKRLAEDGPNDLPPQKKTSEFVRFLKALFAGFSGLLWIGAVLSLIIFYFDNETRSYWNFEYVGLALALVLVVVITGVFAFYQEGKSDKVMQSFLDLIPDQAQVIRGGKMVDLMARDIVVGDVLIIRLGDKISADVRIIESQNLKTDHSGLTGESNPQERISKVTDTVDPLEAQNLAFFGTFAVEGAGRGIVIRTGQNTMMGSIACLTTNIKRAPTIIGQEISRFIRLLMTWATCTGIVIFGIMLGIGYDWKQSLIFFIGIIIANVPEGLMATLTLSFTLASQRMAVRNCLVKRMEAVESLGNTSIICSDKTGTLTQNRMTVSHLWFNRRVFDVHLLEHGFKNSKDTKSTFEALSRCACLCSRAEFKPIPKRGRHLSISHREVVGDASETAILKCKEISSEPETLKIRRQYPKTFEIPFNSYDKFQVSVHETDEFGHILVMKGAPEKVIAKCSRLLLEGKEIPLTAEWTSRVNKACSLLASSGERVLAFCDQEKADYKEGSFKAPETGLRFLGLVSMMDPPRPNVPQAVLECQQAGIKIIMVTGDHHSTAQAIARRVHIISDYSIVQQGLDKPKVSDDSKPNAIVLEGTDLRKLTDAQLDEIIRDFDQLVFARTNPKQKLQIVESCQRLKAVVAVTGDGVNDAPALKKAEIGVAMGISGSAVARQSAEIVLLDDNFATIVQGIQEGRLVFENLKKSIGYTLTHGLPEVILLLTHVLGGLPLPMGVVTMLCIDIGTDMWPSIALAYERPERDLMMHKPRDVQNDRLVNVSMINLVAQMGLVECIAGMFSYFIVMAECGWWPHDLVGIKKKWTDESAVLVDSYGRTWTEPQRKILERTCYTAVYLAVVICQTANAFVFKTTRTSSFKRRKANVNLCFALLFSFGIVAFLSYVPGVSKIFQLQPLRVQWWLPALPFAAVMIAYDEVRKRIIRKKPQGFFAQNTVP